MVAPAKEAVVRELVQLLDSHPIIGVVDMENLPARQLQEMRARLREKGIILRMAKKRLIFKAFGQCKERGVEKLRDHFRGMPALIFTRENPFALFKLLKQSQTSAPIKAGQAAPEEVRVPAGPTSFAPGPVIGELGSVGIKTVIENGKVVIKEEAVVAKAGEMVSPKLAGILSRLDVKPMRLGLKLNAVYEEGKILTREVLDVDEEACKKELAAAHEGALALAFELAFPMRETMEPLLQKAFLDALALARERAILTRETMPELLARGGAEGAALATKLQPLEGSPAVEGKKGQEGGSASGEAEAAPAGEEGSASADTHGTEEKK